MKINNLKSILNQIEKILSKNQHIMAAYVFGSQATGNLHPASDLDIALLLAKEARSIFTTQDELALEDSIYRVIKLENFDLVLLHKAPLILQFRIISHGKRFYCMNEDQSTDFEEMVMSRYYDFSLLLKTFYKEYDQSLKEAYSYG